nr:copia protein [Tanacetum cinerariifolium]
MESKVTAIEKSKDLSSLALDELIGNLKTSRSDDEEYVMAVRNIKKFFRRKGKFVRQPREENKLFRQRDEKKGKSDRKCFRCGDPNQLIGDCPKPSRNKDQKAFIGGSWSDSENDDEDKTNDETCLMAQSSNEVTLNSSCYSDNASSLDNDTGSESRPPMLNKENYIPWSCRLLRYAKSRPNGKLIHNSILNGPYVRKMIPEPGDANRDINITKTSHLLTDDELSDKELKQIEADDQAIQTILLGLPEDIYAAEKKAKLFNEWEKFTSKEGESIESYYHRFLKLMNDLKRNKHFPEKIASNLKFLNNLQPEWSRHVTIVHQTKDLHTADYTQFPPPTKLSPLVDDDVGEEAVRKITKIVNTNNEEDESLEIDEIINIKESKNHPLEQVIGNLNQITLRLKAFLTKHEYSMGMVDNTLFTKKSKSHLIIVQIYVDGIIFGSTSQNLCDHFEKIMHDEFEMSMMGELNFFLGLQIKQMEDEIFFNQSKYVNEMLKKFGLEDSKPTKTPMSKEIKLAKDDEADFVDSSKY